jgi:alpha-beta hydrolase superfamily lysophospholipase
MTATTVSQQDQSSFRAVPIVFGPSSRPLLGFYHTVTGLPTRSLAVVLCNPIGHASMCVHRTYRHLADRLAARGFPTLRFDYDGTGDSAGDSDDPGRLRAWLASIDTAVEEVLARSGARNVGLFGVRLGATLAILAAARRTDVECLIPWATVVFGRAYVRELRAHRLARGAGAAEAAPTRSGEDVAGYFFSEETLSDLSSIDLRTRTNRPAGRALVVQRGERASAEELQFLEHLKAQGTDSRLAPDTAYRRMVRDDPYDSVVPFHTLDNIVDWVAQGDFAEVRPPEGTAPASNAIVFAARDGTSMLRETPILFGEGERLFGVLTELDNPRYRAQPVVCFLNSGVDHHVGPHRMYVELARDGSLQGYPTFRFDVAGLGESRVADARLENRILSMNSIADVQSAMTMLSNRLKSDRFVLVGVCSGAYLAYHTSVRDPRVVGQVLVSPFAFDLKQAESTARAMLRPVASTRAYARALLDYRVWLRVFRGEMDLPRLAGGLRDWLQTQARDELPFLWARLRGQRPVRTEVERAFGTMCDRGVESLLVLGHNDGGLDMIARHLGYHASRMRRRRNFSLQIVDGANHTFTTIAATQKLHDLFRGYMTTHFPPGVAPRASSWSSAKP